MSKEKASQKDATLLEYENLIEELMKENETLKNRIVDLEEQNKLYKDIADSIEKVPESKEAKKPVKLFKRTKKKEEIKPQIETVKASKTHDEKAKAFKAHVDKTKETIVDSQIFKDSSAPKLATHTIIEGSSRRECPVCGNTRHGSIQEIVDKTHIILDYPRMYGKKLKCGQCGQEWRIQSPQ
jgi:primase-polymerase (primpol)-like protein